MSENVSITESGKTRNFSGVGVIETETPEGDSCFWVPESERELETEYVIKNGTYRPQKYGFSDIHVNVFDLTTDLDGNDWKIDIGDIDMPDISLPDFDIDLTIDSSTGLPDISLDGVKIDLPDLSDYLDLDAGIDVSLDVDDLGGVNVDISGVDLNGLDVGVSIDLETMEVDVTDLPDEIRIMHVPDKTSYQDGEAIDIEGIVVQAYKSDGTIWEGIDGEYQDGYIPAHELIITPRIADLSRASDKYEESVLYGFPVYSCIVNSYKTRTKGIWSSAQLRDSFPVIRDGNGGFNRRSVYGFSVSVKGDGVYPQDSQYTFIGNIDDNYYYHAYLESGTVKVIYYGQGIWRYGTTGAGPMPNMVVYSFVAEDTGANGGVFLETFPAPTNTVVRKDAGPYDYIYFINGVEYNTHSYGLFDWLTRAFLETAISGEKTEIDVTKVTVSWARPLDKRELKASFEISINEPTGPSPHSETTHGDSGGHFGGTTISGNYGGSHSSGNF